MAETLLSDPGTATKPGDGEQNQGSANPPPTGSAAPAANPPPKADVVPEKYDLKLPEGSTLTDADLSSVSELAKSLGITKNEAAQKLVDYQNNLLGSLEKQRAEARDADTRKWEDTVRSDKEMGGANYDATLNNAKLALARFDTSGEFRKMLTETRYGSHPEVVRLFSAIGKAMAEDKLVAGGRAGGQRDAASVLFGKSMAT